MLPTMGEKDTHPNQHHNDKETSPSRVVVRYDSEQKRPDCAV